MTGYDSHSVLVGVFQAGLVVRSTLGPVTNLTVMSKDHQPCLIHVGTL